MAGQLTRYLAVSDGEQPLPHQVRVNQYGQASVIDVLMCVCFTSDDGKLLHHASNLARVYYKRLQTDNDEAGIKSFKFPGRGQQFTPVASPMTMKRIVSRCLAGARMPIAKKRKLAEVYGIPLQTDQYP